MKNNIGEVMENIGEIMNSYKALFDYQSYRVLLIIKEELSDEMTFEQSLMLSWEWTNGYFKEYWSKGTTIARAWIWSMLLF